MNGFAWHRRSGRVIATFTGFEADLLRSLTSQLVELLRNERAVPDTAADPLETLMDFSGPTTEPEDPVLRRLFPTAYPDDEEAAGDFRRFTEGGLRDAKARSACAVIDGLEEAGLPPELAEDGLMIDVELDRDEAESWMRTFTDVRLALATRLGVEDGDEERWEAMPADDPRAQAHDIYDWVGYLQETLVRALVKAS
ncbi:DUF2017 domain-containing protein [Nocardioides lentus]|uniref:DUF2017 domain-containing protein n=1 Tax=Nocardioides lentus TaxID=338077 RepID=A0ABN2PE12_9ACTN